MSYFMHRISHFRDWSHPLLERDGFLSIGYSDFKGELDWDKIDQKGREFDWFNGAKKGCLGRFLDMKKGDIVLVPYHSGRVVVCKIDSTSPLNQQMLKDSLNRDYFTTWEDEEGKMKNIDLGYFHKVKILYDNINRNDLKGALNSRLKARQTTLDISDLADTIDELLEMKAEGKELNLKEDVLTQLLEPIRKIITEMNPDKFEQLIKNYFDRIGASYTEIPSKNSANKQGDVDIIAFFDALRHEVYVQAKWHKGETREWAVQQIHEFAKSEPEREADSNTRSYWVITSADNYNEKAVKLAQEHEIVLITGNEFAKMLLDAGLSTIG